MFSTVFSYLVLNNGAAIPHIGNFTISRRPAELDIAHRQMLPPFDEITFEADDDAKASEGLINFISRKKSLDAEHAAIYLNNAGEEWKQKLLRGSHY